MEECFVCKKEVRGDELQQPIEYDGDCRSAHFDCGTDWISAEIIVYKVKSIGYGSSYTDKNLETILDMIKDSDIGESFIIKKQKMNQQQYYCLPEFEGF